VSDRITVGEAVTRLLEGCGVRCAFGVVSIHNMPILDALVGRGNIRYVAARGEAGTVNMADAYARVTGKLGVAVTSTGTGAGNAAGTLIEARNAGTALLHLTGQIDSDYLDRNAGFIHETPDQLTLLSAVSKAAFRARTAESALGTVREAVRIALTPPHGPVSVEIPIDFQKALVPVPDALALSAPAIASYAAEATAVDAVAALLRTARRPVLWLGSGARDAERQAARFARMGWAVVTSIAGRGILSEADPMSLASFGAAPAVEAFFDSCDALVVAGSRLRGNETLRYGLRLPRPRVLIDVDGLADNRSFTFDRFLCGDAAQTLEALAGKLEGALKIDGAFATDVRAARTKAEQTLREGLGPFADLLETIERNFGPQSLWVRDITISNSTFGNRLPAFSRPRQGVHALGGGIGQGLPMAIGAACAALSGEPVLALTGDGGLGLCLAEFGTLAQERAPVVLIVMNDGGYGVIRNIQDHEYGGRRFGDVTAPDFAAVSAAFGIECRRIESVAAFKDGLAWARELREPVLLDVDMAAIGSFVQTWAGPPARKP
jgi:acetolactate synthase I/II/III large subunit